MIGVVVWSDPEQTKAIIWCEDHGDLAYIGDHSNRTAALPLGLDEGDLIQFDLAENHSMRLAHNPRRIARQYCSDLDQVVAKVGEVADDIALSRKTPKPNNDTAHSNVVAFPVQRSPRRTMPDDFASASLCCIAAARLSRPR